MMVAICSSINKTAYENSKDCSRFGSWYNQVADESEALKFCVFNFQYSNDWFYHSIDDARKKYIATKKFYINFKENIQNDTDTIRHLKENKNISLREIVEPTRSGNQPPILQLFLQNRISIDIICLLNRNRNFIPKWEQSIDPLVHESAKRILKYTPFMLKYKDNG